MVNINVRIRKRADGRSIHIGYYIKNERYNYVERLNTPFTIVVIQRRKSIAYIDDALWQNQTKHIQTSNWSVSMRSIDISKANAPPKSAKVLADQECGCGNGLEDTTIPRRVVRRGGSRKNPEQQRMFTGKRIRR